MKRYHLLRNNRELGPFTIRELKELGLYATDLIWIEGESTCWTHPTEMEELSVFSSKSTPVQGHSSTERVPLFSHPELLNESRNSTPAQAAAAEPRPSFAELSKKYAEKMPQRQARLNLAEVGAAAFGMVILSLGVFMVAVVVKDLVVKFKPGQPLATAEAQEISTDNLVQSNVSHAAFASVVPPSTENSVLLSTEVASQTDTATTATVTAIPEFTVNTESNSKKEEVREIKEPTATKSNTRKKAEPTVNLTPEVDSNDKEKAEPATVPMAPVEEMTEEKQAEKKPVAAGVQVSASEYKTGFLGGVSGLSLTVKNTTSKNIEKATIAVDYLKPNGKVVQTQTVEVVDLNAGEVKKVEVPNSSRGVNVRYRVINR